MPKMIALAAILLAAACGGRLQSSPFTLEITPESLTLEPGETRVASVVARRGTSVAAAIELSLDGVPAGVTADVAPIAADSSAAAITFHNRRTGAPVAGVRVTVRGSSGGQTAAAGFEMTVHCPADSPTLAIVAGAPGGFGNADDVGTDARFSQPETIISDGAGHLYVADTFNHTIRKVTVATGEVVTIAGTPGAPGSADGIGPAARFFVPTGLALDGNLLYVVDSLNNTIRRVDLATRAVTTLAGDAESPPGSADGPVLDARFAQPFGVAAAGGSLFVTDAGNDTVRRIDLGTGMVETIAGTPGEAGIADGICDLARFNQPLGIVAVGGKLYVVDANNDTVRRIDIATEAVTTFAGTPGQAGTAGGIGTDALFNFPVGIAWDGADTLYVADSGNFEIRSIGISTADVVDVAGAPSPDCHFDDPQRFCFPDGVAADGSTLYVADSGASVIRVDPQDGSLRRILAGLQPHSGLADGAGPGVRLRAPLLLTSDGADTVYFADANGAIRRLKVSRGEVTTLATGIEIPVGAAFEGGSVYFTSVERAIIGRVDAGGAVTVVAGTDGAFGRVDGDASASRFRIPTGIVGDGNGHLYIADFTSIRVFDVATATVTTLAGADTLGNADGIGPNASFTFPMGLALDGQGALFVADTNSGVVRRIDLVSHAVTTLPGTQFGQPLGVAVDRTTLYVTDGQNGTVSTIDLQSGAVTLVAGVAGVAGVNLAARRLNTPEGIATWTGGVVIGDLVENVLLTLSR